MKRIALFFSASILIVAGLASQVGAQTRGAGYFPNSHGVAAKPFTTPNNDTISGSAKGQVLNAQGFYDDFVIQVNVARLTGTPTTGSSVKLFAGIDGVNFPFQVQTKANDTLAVAGTAPQHYAWDIGANHFPYYKVIYTPFGTHTAQINTQFAWALWLRH
jgi:hypothetical protein